MKVINKNKMLIGFLTLSLMLLSFNLVIAEQSESVNLHIFYGQSCPHCGSALDFLDSIKENYPSLVVTEHETYFNDTERSLFEDIANAYGEEIKGVPTIFIGDEVFVGFSDSIGNSIEDKIINCENTGCKNPVDKIGTEETAGSRFIKKLTVPAVLLAALVDAINPCAFAVLIILMTTILASKDKKKALRSGLAFSLSIFISYFLMGLGLYSAIQTSGLSHIFYTIVAVMAIFIGLFNLKDYLFYGKWFVMEVPLKWRPKMKSLIRGITSAPGAFAMGFVISLFLLPCTSGPYIVILGLLANSTERAYAMFLLLIYNLVFITPMVLITLSIFFGLTTTEKAEKLRQNKLKILHLIAGIIILCLGIGMFVSMKLGMI